MGAKDEVDSNEDILSSDRDTREIESTLEVLSRIDFALAYSSEKLINLHVLLMHLLARDDDLETMLMGRSDISDASIEKALVYDLLSGILDSELREVGSFLDILRAEIVDARHNVSSCRNLTELLTIAEEKLCDSEESLKQSQEHVVELKMQSDKLQRDISSIKFGTQEYDRTMEFSGNSQLLSINGKSKLQTAKQHRHVLRMLEKSLARELDLEKKMSELQQNEEQLKVKLHHTEQVAFRMEEAAEVVWGRFLEAENASEVLMGISKEQLGKLQIVQFNLNGSLQREAEMRLKIDHFIEQLKNKDMALQMLESKNAELIMENSEVVTLKAKVKLLEDQLKESEIRMGNATASYEASQDQINEMESFIESMKESLYEAESRAESAEAKVNQLTDTNLELTDELNLLKSNNESNTKKLGMFENQVRELEIQLQHAKVSTEAGQEQQNMLYSAIWDMETLIEDLKSKVAKAESKTETAEEQCIILSETNSELHDELNFLRDRLKVLESSLNQENDSKAASAKEINLRTELIMDMVVQLASQREIIQKQLYALTKENKELVEKLRYREKSAAATTEHVGNGEDREPPVSSNNPMHAAINMKAPENVESLGKTFQVDELSKESMAHEAAEGPSTIESNSTEMASMPGAMRIEEAGDCNRKRILMAVFVALVSVSALYILNTEPLLFDHF